MHRFRKKSDASYNQVHPVTALRLPVSNQPQLQSQPLPSLPPESDFRTSLILPDLTRRFTLLRTSSGNLIPLDDIRNRFAEKRARALETAISEEEEDMLVEALSRIRMQNSKGVKNVDEVNTNLRSSPSSVSYSASDNGHTSVRQSSQSSATVSSSNAGHEALESSPGSRASKRHSNNMFSSGQFRDFRHMRRATNKSSARSINSLASSISTSRSGLSGMTGSYQTLDESLNSGSITPDQYNLSQGATSSSAEYIPTIQPIAMTITSEDIQPVVDLQLSKPLGRAQLQRLSTSFEEVIREMEEEADDQVLLPRSPLPQVNSYSARSGFSAQPAKLNIGATQPLNDQEEPSPSTDWIAVERPDSVSELVSPYPRSGTASPVPKVPGYIPGMPRPMTPRETETDDLRSYSTTPRATAPVYDKSITPLPIHAHDLLRHDSSASTARLSPRSASPSVLSHSQRSGNGRYTPEEWHKNGETLTDSSHTLESPTSNKRRPASPLSNNVYQPLVTSRPSTPSNVTWNVRPKSPMQPNKQQAQSEKASSHIRDGSNYNINEYEGTTMFALERSKSMTRSLRSPPLPDSPLIDGDAANYDRSIDSQNELYISNQASPSPSPIPKLELESPVMTPDVRSPIPVLGSPISPLSSTLSYADADRLLSTPVTSVPLTPFPAQQITPLALSPASNSSRSSVISAGSSYHSWNEEHAADGLGVGILGDLSEKEPAWHDFSDEEMLPPEKDPEVILRHFTGLTKYDLAAIQMKLFEATQNRPKNSESRTSTLRRRRPSTAQSIHSLGGRESRTTSPAPQSPLTASFSVDHTAKANALLNSVVDSIIDPIMDGQNKNTSSITDVRKDVQALPDQHNEHISSALPAESSPTRRNKDLADILFGPSNKEQPILSVHPVDSMADEFVDFHSLEYSLNNQEARNEAKQLQAPGTPALVSTSSNVSLQYPPVDQSQLAKLIQEKTEAAMAQLGKDSLRLVHSPPARKKVNPQDISSPRLVQSSTHVTPAASMQSSPTPTSMVTSHDSRQSSSKITSRMRKLRNTLRVKAQPTSSDELSQWMHESSTPDLDRSHKKLSTPSPINLPSSDSTADLSRSRRVDGSSLAYSSSTSKFGFMSRFRKRNQGDSPPELDRKLNSPYVRHPTPTVDTPPFSAPPFSRVQYATANRNVVSPSSRNVDVHPGTQTPSLSRSGTLPKHSPRTPDENALKQFFDAAENLGLDQAALNEFVATQSSNSRMTASTMRSAELIRQNSMKETARGPSHEASSSQATSSPERQLAATPDPPLRTPILILPDSDENSRAFSVSPDIQNSNTIVRRTLIFPSDNASNSDLTTLLSKVSKKGHRFSTNSIQSGRSIHDRAPTPPPPRVKRFSTEPSPPVPKLPSSIPTRDQSEMPSPSPFSASQSGRVNAYDSLYDMYSDTYRQTTIETEEPNGDTSVETSATPDPGQIVEVIEMANGETIWSIVNGLRDEDIDSMNPRRISVASEYSVVPGDGDEQLFFKEHVRNTSKGSNVSFLSRKRNTHPINRPETKVFYSSSSQIARLIEQLSHNADAGSFNIKPKVPANHSHSSSFQSESDINWTVEERLERMLGSMQT